MKFPFFLCKHLVTQIGIPSRDSRAAVTTALAHTAAWCRPSWPTFPSHGNHNGTEVHSPLCRTAMRPRARGSPRCSLLPTGGLGCRQLSRGCKTGRQSPRDKAHLQLVGWGLPLGESISRAASRSWGGAPGPGAVAVGVRNRFLDSDAHFVYSLPSTCSP